MCIWVEVNLVIEINKNIQRVKFVIVKLLDLY
jgi:hypothetical protein